MYRLKSGVKRDHKRRWALPDRIFFAHGACHILAGAYLENQPLNGFFGERIVPRSGRPGNHIYVTNGHVSFDYRGYANRERMLSYHANGWSELSPEGWSCIVEQVNFDLLSTCELNNRKMLGPNQYWGDPVVRARQFINRVDHNAAATKACATQSRDGAKVGGYQS